MASNIANNINQIAVRVNSTGNIYADDIAEIKDGVSKLWQPLNLLQTKILQLEFTKMLEYDIRLHRCKICGRYFIIKGNYVSDFCNRVREGNTRTCQQIGAQRKYDDRLKTDEAVALFRKYYKRYYALTKVNQIKPDKFREWNYKACEMRDRCQNGEITSQEFEEWLYGSFKNRKKKEK